MFDGVPAGIAIVTFRSSRVLTLTVITMGPPQAGEVLRDALYRGADRVIFGSDAGGRSFASQLAKVTSADLPEAALRRVLGGNLRRLLAPALSRP